MEVCVSVYYWVCEIVVLGYEIWLILLVYVKLFVKWQKNDMVDVEVICEVVQCLMMWFVGVKSVEVQGVVVVFCIWDLLVCQCMQFINVLCGYFGEFGFVVW